MLLEDEAAAVVRPEVVVEAHLEVEEEVLPEAEVAAHLEAVEVVLEVPKEVCTYSSSSPGRRHHLLAGFSWAKISTKMLTFP